MKGIVSTYSNFDVFVLKHDYADSLVLLQEPDGWSEDGIKLTRHTEYHGIFISFTNKLTFRGEAIDYINLAYEIDGINANLRLTKYSLREKDGEIKYVEQYTGLADFKTKKIQNYGLEINFNSNELEDIIKSHQSDDFELERLTSIDDEYLEVLELQKVSLSGRTISGVSRSKIGNLSNLYTSNITNPNFDFLKNDLFQSFNIYKNQYSTVITSIVSKSHERFSSVDSNNNTDEASQMFFVDSTVINSEIINLDIKYDFEFYAGSTKGLNNYTDTVKFFFRILEWNITTNSYDEVLIEEIHSVDIVATFPVQINHFIFSGSKKYVLNSNQGIMLCMRTYGGEDWNNYGPGVFFKSSNLYINTTTFYENSNNLSCLFFHDAIDRLLYIMTGEKNKFYSKFFGRQSSGKYMQNGEAGLVALISGFWARAFDTNSDRYKSMQLSLKNAISSAQAVWNIGVGIETVNLKQRLRFEKLEYFYQQQIVIKLPNQLTNVVRTIDSNLFFSGTEIGFEYGGDYESEVGLDEPNTRTKTVTPIRKSDLKYSRISKIRGDDTGLELIRRKPQLLYPDEDTSQDEHNWWLDLKETYTGLEQLTWEDVLQEEPNGVISPNNYKGMRLTPLRMLFRHGFVLRAGLEPYYNKFIKYASSKANTLLSMFFIGETKAYKENDDILVNDLDRARFLPDIIEGEHYIDDELMDIINGTTRIFYEGEWENIPNIYFKFQFINEKEEVETGYLLDLDIKDTCKFKFQKANENLLR